MDSEIYQSDIIHDIEILFECIVFAQKRYIFIHDIALAITLNILEYSKNVKKYPF